MKKLAPKFGKKQMTVGQITANLKVFKKKKKASC